MPGRSLLVLSLPSRRLTQAEDMVPELLALGASIRRLLDARDAPRVWLLVSADLAHTHPAGVNPYPPNATAASAFDTAIGVWARTLDAPPLVEVAAALASYALSCGFTGLIALHGALAAGPHGITEWTPRVWASPSAPTYYGMMVATFVRA